jgi:putative ABC transport system substrate-binding protein
MKRRTFIAGLGSAAAWPVVVRAQQQVPVVGFLSVVSAAHEAAAFRLGLSEAGYVEGRNVSVEYRSAGDRYDRLPALAAELVGSRVNVIVAYSTNAAVAAKAATSVTPIVFYVGFDPVELGLVASLNRPGGNMTGVTTLNAEVEPKRFELLHTMLPAATTIAVLINPTDANSESHVRSLQAAARTFGELPLHMLVARVTRTEGRVFSA